MGTFKDSGTFGGSFQHQGSGVPNGMTAASFVGRQPDEMSDTATIEFKDSYGKRVIHEAETLGISNLTSIMGPILGNKDRIFGEGLPKVMTSFQT